MTWKIFGNVPWLHHLGRWILHFGAVGIWSAAFLCLCRGRTRSRMEHASTVRAPAAFPLLPLAFLVHVWIFFPNAPYARLSPQEVLTVLFLGMCVLSIALFILDRGEAHGNGRVSSSLLRYGLLNLGCIGLLLAKEINIAAVLPILVFHYALLSTSDRRREWRMLAGSLPTVLASMYTLWVLTQLLDPAITRNSGVHFPEISWDLVIRNLRWLLVELFQVRTSWGIAAGFLCLLAVLPVVVTVGVAKRRLHHEHLFLLFLGLLFAGMVAALLTSWLPVLRYWYPLVPLLAILLAFSVRSLLEAAARRGSNQANAARIASGCFLLFFIGCNYYNFLYQTFIQYDLRSAESRLISEITSIHDRGHHLRISAEPWDEHKYALLTYFKDYSPQYLGREMPRIDSYSSEREEGHYLVVFGEPLDCSGAPMGWEVYKTIDLRERSAILSYASSVAGIFQGKRPYLGIDGGVRFPEEYQWRIYSSAPMAFDELADPVIRSDFDVYHDDTDGTLTYVNDDCREEDVHPAFFLRVDPVDPGDLPESSRPRGFQELDFRFERRGGIRRGSQCVVTACLPDYPVRCIRTGQYSRKKGEVWQGTACLER